MTKIGPSSDFISLIQNAKADKKMSQQEATQIKNKLTEETKDLKTESQLNDYMTNFEKEIQGFDNVDVKVKVNNQSSNMAPSSFNFNVKGKFDIKSAEPIAKPQLIADGKDFNSKERTELKNQPDGQKIIDRYDYLAKDPNLSLTPKAGKTSNYNLAEVSKQDLKGLKDTFGDDSQKFLDALKKNPKFQTATLKDATTILQFAKNGCTSEADVKSIQSALKNVGPDLKARFEKNGKDLGQGKGIDGQYGFATMEGLRYLSSVMKESAPAEKTVSEDVSVDVSGQVQDDGKDWSKLIPENKQVMVAIDVSGSMAGNKRETLDNYDKVVAQNSSSDIGIVTFNGNSGEDGTGSSVLFKPGEGSQVEQKFKDRLDQAKNRYDKAEANVNDMRTQKVWLQKPDGKSKWDEAVKEKNESLKDLNVIKRATSPVQEAINASKGTHDESGAKAVYESIKQIDPKGKEPYILVQTDEPDHSPDAVKNLITDALEGKLKAGDKKIDPKNIVFFDPDKNTQVSLQELVDKFSTNGKFDNHKFKEYKGKDGDVPGFAIFEHDKAKIK